LTFAINVDAASKANRENRGGYRGHFSLRLASEVPLGAFGCKWGIASPEV
jgi:hypothetical protein